jgi:predicted nuclease of restriction endonuclease-like (RecB) superfamily
VSSHRRGVARLPGVSPAGGRASPAHVQPTLPRASVDGRGAVVQRGARAHQEREAARVSGRERELVGLYWQVGAYVSKKLASAEWGDGVVVELARAIASVHPGMRGFTARNLFRMRQFYDAYRDNEKVSPLVTHLPWTHHLILMSQTKTAEESEFYMASAIRARWTKRELERQIRSHAFARASLDRSSASKALTRIQAPAIADFKNAYSLEFLGLPSDHSEADLHGALLRDLRRFLAELGRDFRFVGSEYPVQVGKQDFAIDLLFFLLFFRRGLSCLVAIELKVRESRPEDLGELSFYLEALDRDVRKEHERPSIGVLLCADKDAEVVEYALSRTLSPALVAEYQTALPEKALLQAKLTFSMVPGSMTDRRSYFDEALRVLDAALAHDERVIVLLDPDTGIEPPSGGSSAQVLQAEVAAVFQKLRAGDVVVVYQHSRRSADWLDATKRELATALGMAQSAVDSYTGASVC